MSWRVLRCEEALAADKTIDCWGGNNIWSNIDYGLTDAPDGQYTAIAAGWDHSCAIAADNTIDCWGDNRYGQANVPVPVFDASAEGIAVAPGGTVACTVAWNGEPELVCSGGQAGGDGTSPDDAQTNMASLNGTVSAPSGVSTDDVVVSVVAFCWGGCDGGGQPGGSAERPRGLDPAEFLAETGVDSSGRWSVAVPEPQSQDLNALWLLVWDEGGVLAPHYRFVWVLWPDVEFGDIDIGDADVELEAGGRVTGRFSTPDGRPPPSGDYALWGSGDWLLDVDPQTGEFTSPVVAPGDYSLAHGNHVEGHLTNNAAAEVEVAAGQTADAGTVRVQQLGQITVAIAYSDGQPIQGVAVSGRITSQNPYQSMPPSPFSTTGTGFFSAANDDDGTLTAQGLYPGEDWQITMVIPTGGQYTAIAAGGEHTCAIAADQTIDCWGGNDYGQADAPDGQYTAIATGSLQTCAIAADQTIDCWGRNDYGEADAPGGRYTAIAAG
ncbi:hypothetical protein, partial [Candidatus Poriferisocius sp.]|uniref:hypothetical protein n=1 Tax=Candidatus Poriferisocius sp. TaxID=3101276 RepID=UPI003B51E482